MHKQTWESNYPLLSQTLKRFETSLFTKFIFWSYIVIFHENFIFYIKKYHNIFVIFRGINKYFKCITFFFNFGFVCLFVYLFIYLWLCWVFVSVWGLSLVAASGGHSSSWCAGLSLSWPLLLQSTGSRRAGSVIVAHGPSCSAACGIFTDQGSNPCPLHWQADSQPLRHQGSP